MEKASYISPRQALCLLLITRLSFSTAYLVSLRAGSSVQDVLLAVPVNFLLNFAVAAPFLLLFAKRPNKDPIESAVDLVGKPAAVVIALFYVVFFLLQASTNMASFNIFFVNSIIPEAKFYAIAVPMLLVCLYGVVKGIESMARFSGLVLLIYVVTVIMIFFSVLPQINLGYLMPLFYSGPKYFLLSVYSGLNSNIQILLLAFLLPFFRAGTATGKIYVRWNIYASLGFFFLLFLEITVMGPFAAKQNTPLYSLSLRASSGVFERLEQIDMISWILNTIIYVGLYLYLSTVCLLKIGLNNYRKPIAVILSVILLIATRYFTGKFDILNGLTLTPVVTVLNFVALLGIPILLLAADFIRGRLTQNENA